MIDGIGLHGELALRLALAAVAGALVGLERELRDQAAGLRTHMLVSLGACIFAIVSAYGFEAVAGGQFNARYDVTRVASNIVTGVGFLGAGTIIRQGFSIRGLTTAASLWVVAAIGTAVALGMYWVTGIALFIAIASLWGLRRVRTRLRSAFGFAPELLTMQAASEAHIDVAIDYIRRQGHRIRGLNLDESEEQEGINVDLRIQKAPESVMHRLVSELSALPGIQNLKWERE